LMPIQIKSSYKRESIEQCILDTNAGNNSLKLPQMSN
jgi:hypothetical protein